MNAIEIFDMPGNRSILVLPTAGTTTATSPIFQQLDNLPFKYRRLGEGDFSSKQDRKYSPATNDGG